MPREADTGWRLESAAVRPVQELGAIEARSKEVATASGDDAALGRRASNSIRRSKALERIIG